MRVFFPRQALRGVKLVVSDAHEGLKAADLSPGNSSRYK